MQAFEIGELLASQSGPWQEFVRTNFLSAGLYRLPIGEVDHQQPHTEDEIYYILSGQAILKVGQTDHQVKAGSLVLVEANIEHRFHSITEELTTLVFFAPAEYSLKKE